MRNLFLSCFFAVGLAAPLFSQIPPDWGAYSAIEWTICSRGLTGGVWAFGPRSPLGSPLVRPITGLPAELTGTGKQQKVGSNSILVRHGDGALVVGELSQPPTPYPSVDIWLLTLNVFAVKKATRYVVRTGQGGVAEMDWLPDGRIVFCYHMSSPVVNVGLAILNLRTGTITDIPVTGVPAGEIVNALTVSPNGKTIYFATWWQTPAGQYLSRINSLPIKGGRATSCVVVQASTQQLEMDTNGNLLVGEAPGAITSYSVARCPFGPPVRRINPPINGGLNSLEVDRVAGNYLAVMRVGTTHGLYSITPTGKPTLISNRFTGCPSLLYAFVAGISMRNSVEEYGRDSPGKNRYSWGNHPGPFPRIGTTFPLTVTSAPNSAPGVILLGASPLPLPGFQTGLGFFLTVNPVPSVVLSAGNAKRITVNLPIPNDVKLRGASVFFQSIHSEPPFWRSTRGLCVTIL